MASLIGDDDGVGFGVKGLSARLNGTGVDGSSTLGDGIRGSTTQRSAVGVRGVYAGKLPGGGVAIQGETAHGAAAVRGRNGSGAGVQDDDIDGTGVWGDSANGPGLAGTSISSAGVLGESVKDVGVRGLGHSAAPAVAGMNDDDSKSSTGSWSPKSCGVYGASHSGDGVYGESTGSKTQGRSIAGVVGLATNPEGFGLGVYGEGRGKGGGVMGRSRQSWGVAGLQGDPHLEGMGSSDTVGVLGASEIGVGVLGYSMDSRSPGVHADGGLKATPGFKTSDAGQELAGWFVGDVQVDGDIFLPGADCAEYFDAAGVEEIEAGSVVVIDAEGRVRACFKAYDRAVAGVVAGAGGFRSAIVLDKTKKTLGRCPIALVGKVFCKVDAQYSPIEVGDLLTTSPTAGHAMRATDPAEAFGAVVGKALGACPQGVKLIPILTGLQ